MRTSEKNKTHPLVLGKSGKSDPAGEGYTIFKNTDEELVAKIKSLNTTTDTWKEHGLKGLCKLAQVLNEKQRLCVDEAGVYFLKDVDRFEGTNRDNILDEINNTYDVVDSLNKIFGQLYTQDGYKRVIFKSYKDYLKENAGHKNIDNVKSMLSGWGSMGRVSSDEVGLDLNVYEGVTLAVGNGGGSSMFCHYNIDGNICNRDYNYDIKYVLGNKPKTRKDLIEEIASAIPDVSYKNYGNKWFASSFAFVLEKIEPGEKYEKSGSFFKGKPVFKLSRLEHKFDDKYGDRYSGTIKMPKNTVVVTREDILSKILPLANEVKINDEELGGPVDLSSYFDASKIAATEVKTEQKKRIQKTKIKENKYSEIFDFVEDDDILKDKKLMKALSNLENGIEIGESEDAIREIVTDYLRGGDLPSFSFDKGEEQEDHDDYIALVKLPHGCNFTFKVKEGDACEITWAHSIYYTDIIEFELIP